MTLRQANVLTVVGLLGLLATVALTAPRWAALLRSPAGPTEAEEAAATDAAAARAVAEGDAATSGASRRISVRLYFEAPDRDGLLPEEREVAFASDLADELRIVVEELVKGPTTGLVGTLPPETRVQEVFVQSRGVACVSLSAEASTGLPGGSKAELMTVYSIVNTLVTNFPAVRRVQLVLNDQVASSLGGHVDLSRPLPADMTLLALDAPPVAPSASPEPDASAAPAAPAPR